MNEPPLISEHERMRLGNELSALAARHLAESRYGAALDLLLDAAKLTPGRPDRITAMAPCFKALGLEAEAELCERSLLPESLWTRLGSGLDQPSAVDVENWQSGIRHYAHAPESMILPVTQPWHGGDVSPRLRWAHSDSPGTFVDEIPRGQFWFDGCNTLVLDAHGRIVAAHSRANPELALAASRSRPATSLTGRVCLLDARSSPNYYHFLLDVLPKFAVLEQAGIDQQSIDHFVVRIRSGFQREALLRLGVEERRIHSVEGDLHIEADELLVPYLRHELGERVSYGLGLAIGSWVAPWLRSRLLPAAAPTQRRRKLFIRRRSEFGRAVNNEAELVSALEARGFEALELESMSLAEQIQCFSEADTVIAVHGAALANIAFAQPGARLLELYGDFVAPCYRALALLNGMDYAAMGGSSNGSERSANIDIDIKMLLQQLDRRATPGQMPWSDLALTSASSASDSSAPKSVWTRVLRHRRTA